MDTDINIKALWCIKLHRRHFCPPRSGLSKACVYCGCSFNACLVEPSVIAFDLGDERFLHIRDHYGGGVHKTKEGSMNFPFEYLER